MHKNRICSLGGCSIRIANSGNTCANSWQLLVKWRKRIGWVARKAGTKPTKSKPDTITNHSMYMGRLVFLLKEVRSQRYYPIAWRKVGSQSELTSEAGEVLSIKRCIMLYESSI